ncbi:type II secretion system F family protein [Eubacteriaceae bacterium ES2]|nr:type II secretion system F family protein [Eubacteriaceae bacterium ES2]
MQAFLVTIPLTVLIFFLVYISLKVLFAKRQLMEKRMSPLLESGNKELEILKRSRQKRSKVKLFKRIANDLAMSGIMIRPIEFLLVWLSMAVMPSLIVFMISQNLIVALILSGIGLMLPPLYVKKKRTKRVELFEQQLVEAIGIMSSCLKSGLTFQQALVSIAIEMPDPISEEFSRIVRELKLGSTIEDSLMRLSDKIGSQNFMMMVSAILIQRQTGGNLSEILMNISGTIKERFKIKNEIKVLTATARTSGLVVGLMPVAVILIFLVFNAEYVTVFFESSLGIGMIVAGILMEIIGYLFIRKIVNIPF